MKKVDAKTEHDILRHHLVDDWPVGTVARELGVHHDVVRRVLRQRQVGTGAPQVVRARMIDPYLAYVKTTLEKYPKLHASRLFHMLRARGYEGSESHFRKLIVELRPRPAPEPFARLDMPPAEQAQVDWGHFGTVMVGRAKRPLHAFVMTLCWSRMTWLFFFYDMERPSFLRGHIDGFAFFGGVPRQLVYDNLKSACIERQGPSARFNESLLEMASHYGFEPVLAAPRRGNEKGRVERTIRYIRTSFFAAREFHDIGDLNAQARDWCTTTSAERRWQDDDRTTVGAQFAIEKPQLRALPNTPHEATMRIQARVGRTPYVRFDTNDYSLPCKHVRRTVTVLAEPHRLRIEVDGEIVAEHARCFDRKSRVEDPKHLEDLLATKRKAREGAGMSRLTTAVPATRLMIKRAAERGQNLGSLVAKLLELLDMYGAAALEVAATEANEHERVGHSPVRAVLEARQRATGRAEPRPVVIANDRIRDVTVEAPDLADYDLLSALEDDDAES